MYVSSAAPRPFKNSSGGARDVFAPLADAAATASSIREKVVRCWSTHSSALCATSMLIGIEPASVASFALRSSTPSDVCSETDEAGLVDVECDASGMGSMLGDVGITIPPSREPVEKRLQNMLYVESSPPGPLSH